MTISMKTARRRLNVDPTTGGTTPVPTSAPTETVGTPTVLSATANSDGTTATFDIDWPAVTEAIDAYRILRSDNGGAYNLVYRKPIAGAVGEASRYIDATAPLNVPVRYEVTTERNGLIGTSTSSPSTAVTVLVTDVPTTPRLSYEDQWYADSNPFNKPLPGRAGTSGSVTPDSNSAAVISKLVSTVSVQGAAGLLDNAEEAPIFIAPSAAGTVGGVTWAWYTCVGNDIYTGSTLLGGMKVLAHSGVDFGGGSDNPLVIVMPQHSPPSGAAYGSQVYVRFFQGHTIDHVNKTISADSGGVFGYGPTATLNPKIGNGLGWGIGWVGILRLSDVRKGSIKHALRFAANNTKGGGNFWVPSASGSSSSAVFRAPAIKTDQVGGSGGALIMGMRLCLPSTLTDAQIRNRYVYTGSSYQTHAENVLRDRGPNSGNTVAWPANGGPNITERELLQMMLVSMRDYGFFAGDGGGTGVQISMEHRLTAKWANSTGGPMHGEPPGGIYGWGRVIRDWHDGGVPDSATDCGVPWETAFVAQAGTL